MQVCIEYHNYISHTLRNTKAGIFTVLGSLEILLLIPEYRFYANKKFEKTYGYKIIYAT